MKALIAGALGLLLAAPALAQSSVDAIVCSQVGYTNNPDNFHNINTHERTNVFLLGTGSVVFRDKVFTTVDPASVGLAGLATTYYLEQDSRILYLYKDDHGVTNIGISHYEMDSDAGFMDKSLYTQCSSMIKTDDLDAQSNPDAEDRRVLSPKDLQYLQSDISPEEGFPPGARK
jgi:hypothetical protein